MLDTATSPREQKKQMLNKIICQILWLVVAICSHIKLTGKDVLYNRLDGNMPLLIFLEIFLYIFGAVFINFYLDYMEK